MRTPILLTRLALLGACAGAGLLACAPLGGPQSWPASFEDATPAAAYAYLAGRNHHLAHRYDEARAAYAAALQAAPRHVEARNGLATLHAEQRDLKAAIALWRDLTTSLTLSSGPGKAYLFSNLGHAYFLSGDYDQALAALEKACLLDPLKHRSWQMLGETLRKLGHEERAALMLAQAEALRAHDFRADYAAAGAPSRVAAIDRAARMTERDDAGWSQLQLHTGADGMLELRRTPVRTALQQQPGPLPNLPDAVLPPVVLLEVRNGNGVRGMARMLARQLGEGGWKVARVSNQKGFGVRRTRIEYEAAHRTAAERLAERFGATELHEVEYRAPAGVRVVLGRDIARRGFALRPAAPAPGRKSGLLVASKAD